MKQAPLPSNESARLRSLETLKILDTEVEARYDELTALAARICDVPICLISLIDKDRQWFKSHHGLDARETPREVAFCSHAILGDDIMEIPDSRLDERFFDNPLVTELPNVVFYAGMPLTGIAANNLGTLCVIDQQPKALNEDQREALRVIAHQVQTQFELRRALSESRDEQNRAKQIAQAKSIFMSNICHEILGPLQGIDGATKLLKHSTLTDRQLRLVSMLQESSDTLTQLNCDVTDLVKIESGRMKIMAEPFSFSKLIVELVADNQVQIEGKHNSLNLTLDQRLDDMIVGDSNCLRQILIHLLAHANSVTNGSEIRLDASVVNGQSQSGKIDVHIMLADKGPFLPEAVLHNLFQRFEQTEACDAAELASTGIGLALAHKLTLLIGGELTVKSDEQDGCTFIVKLSFQGVEPVAFINDLRSDSSKKFIHKQAHLHQR